MKKAVEKKPFDSAKVFWTIIIVAQSLMIIGLWNSPKGDTQIKEVIKEVPVEKVVEKEVVKEVVKDNPDTLARLEKHRKVACAYANIYPPMYEVMVAYASDWGLSDMITSDVKQRNSDAKTYVSKYCKDLL